MNQKACREVADKREFPFVRPARRRVIPLALVVFIGVLASLGGGVLVYQWETQDEVKRLNSQFVLDARECVDAIKRELDIHLQVLQSVGALYQASERVTREEFRVFARKLLETVPSIQALEWVPRIEDSQRRRYEEQARIEFPGFRLTMRDNTGALVAAPPRAEYFPVYFVEPLVGNESALGFDLMSEKVRRKTLRLARDSGRITVSGSVTLVQETEDQVAQLAYLPIYRKGSSLLSVEQRQQNLEGFALLVWRVGDLIEHAISRLASAGIDVWILDTTVRETSEFLYGYTPSGSMDTAKPVPASSALRAEYIIEVGGRQWQVIAAPSPETLTLPVSYATWLMLFAGLAITGILAWYMRELQRYGLEMAQANRALDREVAKHRQTGAELKKSDERFRQILESAADAILIADDEGRILKVNHQAERLFGFNRHELLGQPIELLLPEDLRVKRSVLRQEYFSHPEPCTAINNMELSGRRKDGTLIPLEISISPTGKNEERMVTAIIRDISARKAAEAELRRLNRTHTVLSRCNNSLARSIDEENLLQAFCANLVEVGGYSFAWIGYSAQNGSNDVRVMARAGGVEAGLSDSGVMRTDSGDEKSPCGTAIYRGQTVVLRDIGQEVKFSSWRESALQLGFRSMISLPLKADSVTFGNFSIFSTEVHAFNESEVQLLTELAEDLSFGIGTLRARAAHQRKVRLLREEVERDTRKRVAAALHDGVAQSVQAVNLSLKRLRALSDGDRQSHADLLNQIIDDVGGIIGELREVSHELRPLFLERMGLVEAIRYYCSELSERSGIAVHVLAQELPVPVRERVKEQCFLGFREALGNAIKHANASRIDVALEVSGTETLGLRIADDGDGFDTLRTFNSPVGLGLAMIVERAESIGGRAEIQSTLGMGTRVTIRVPLDPDATATSNTD